MTKRYRLTRDLPAGEPGNFFPRDLKAGTVLYGCTGAYARCNVDFAKGACVTEDPDGGYPGYEVPLSAVEEVPATPPAPAASPALSRDTVIKMLQDAGYTAEAGKPRRKSDPAPADGFRVFSEPGGTQLVLWVASGGCWPGTPAQKAEATVKAAEYDDVLKAAGWRTWPAGTGWPLVRVGPAFEGEPGSLDLHPGPAEIAAAWVPPETSLTLRGAGAGQPERGIGYYVAVSGGALPWAVQLIWRETPADLEGLFSYTGRAMWEVVSRRLADAARQSLGPTVLYVALEETVTGVRKERPCTPVFGWQAVRIRKEHERTDG